MPAPDSTAEDVRGSVLKYLRMYEEGNLTLGDLAAELAVMAPAYNHAIGGIADHWSELLGSADEYRKRSAADATTFYADLEAAVTRFPRAEAAW